MVADDAGPRSRRWSAAARTGAGSPSRAMTGDPSCQQTSSPAPCRTVAHRRSARHENPQRPVRRREALSRPAYRHGDIGPQSFLREQSLSAGRDRLPLVDVHGIRGDAHDACPTGPAPDAPAHVRARDPAQCHIQHQHLRPGMRVVAMLNRHRGRARAPHDAEVLGNGRDHRAHRVQGERIIIQYADTDCPRRNPNHIIMPHAAHRSHAHSRMKTCCHAIA